MDKATAVMQEGIDKKLNDFKNRQSRLEEEQIKQRDKHDSAISSLKSEVLWRIKDAEELIRSRVSEVRMQNIIQEVKQALQVQVSQGIDGNLHLL